MWENPDDPPTFEELISSGFSPSTAQLLLEVRQECALQTARIIAAVRAEIARVRSERR